MEELKVSEPFLPQRPQLFDSNFIENKTPGNHGFDIQRNISPKGQKPSILIHPSFPERTFEQLFKQKRFSEAICFLKRLGRFKIYHFNHPEFLIRLVEACKEINSILLQNEWGAQSDFLLGYFNSEAGLIEAQIRSKETEEKNLEFEKVEGEANIFYLGGLWNLFFSKEFLRETVEGITMYNGELFGKSENILHRLFYEKMKKVSEWFKAIDEETKRLKKEKNQKGSIISNLKNVLWPFWKKKPRISLQNATKCKEKDIFDIFWEIGGGFESLHESIFQRIMDLYQETKEKDPKNWVLGRAILIQCELNNFELALKLCLALAENSKDSGTIFKTAELFAEIFQNWGFKIQDYLEKELRIRLCFSLHEALGVKKESAWEEYKKSYENAKNNPIGISIKTGSVLWRLMEIECSYSQLLLKIYKNQGIFVVHECLLRMNAELPKDIDSFFKIPISTWSPELIGEDRLNELGVKSFRPLDRVVRQASSEVLNKNRPSDSEEDWEEDYSKDESGGSQDSQSQDSDSEEELAGNLGEEEAENLRRSLCKMEWIDTLKIIHHCEQGPETEKVNKLILKEINKLVQGLSKLEIHYDEKWDQTASNQNELVNEIDKSKDSEICNQKQVEDKKEGTIDGACCNSEPNNVEQNANVTLEKTKFPLISHLSKENGKDFEQRECADSKELHKSPNEEIEEDTLLYSFETDQNEASKVTQAKNKEEKLPQNQTVPCILGSSKLSMGTAFSQQVDELPNTWRTVGRESFSQSKSSNAASGNWSLRKGSFQMKDSGVFSLSSKEISFEGLSCLQNKSALIRSLENRLNQRQSNLVWMNHDVHFCQTHEN